MGTRQYVAGFEDTKFGFKALIVAAIITSLAFAVPSIGALLDIAALLIAIFGAVVIFQPMEPRRRMIVALAAVLLISVALVASARASDVGAKRPAFGSLFNGYAAGQCGMYFGLNTMGSSSSVAGGTPGASINQGDIGVTVGYGCPINNMPGSFWFAEGNFDWANMNGSQSGFAMTGPLHFEQRVGLGSPISAMLNLFPSLSNGLSVPAMPILPNGITAGPSYPFIFASLHEQDFSAQFTGLGSSREWLISPGVGIGLQSRLSNNVVAETAVQWVMQSSGLSIGPQKVNLGNGVEVSFTLKY